METVEFYNTWDIKQPPAKFEEFEKLRPVKTWFDTKTNQMVVCEKSALFHSYTSPAAMTEAEWTACIAYRIEEMENRVRKVSQQANKNRVRTVRSCSLCAIGKS